MGYAPGFGMQFRLLSYYNPSANGSGCIVKVSFIISIYEIFGNVEATTYPNL